MSVGDIATYWANQLATSAIAAANPQGCVNGLPTSRGCSCFEGWQGQGCQLKPICDASIVTDCGNGSITGDVWNDSCICQCDHGWQGANCRTRVPCTNSCVNGYRSGTVESNNCVCNCNHGWQGGSCNVRVACTNTCHNGGSRTGYVSNNSCGCNCAHGFQGSTCANRVPCSNSCVHGWRSGYVSNNSCWCNCHTNWGNNDCNCQIHHSHRGCKQGCPGGWHHYSTTDHGCCASFWSCGGNRKWCRSRCSSNENAGRRRLGSGETPVDEDAWKEHFIQDDDMTFEELMEMRRMAFEEFGLDTQDVEEEEPDFVEMTVKPDGTTM